MVRAIRCHRKNTKTNIINGSEVSGLSVAIQRVLIIRELIRLSTEFRDTRLTSLSKQLLQMNVFNDPVSFLTSSDD